MAQRNMSDPRNYAAFIKTDRGMDPLTPTAAVLKMLRLSPDGKGKDINKPKMEVKKQNLDRVSRKISQNIIDNDTIMQILSDTELVETVLIASILAPKDMGDTELSFTSDPVIFDSELARLMIEPVEHHFKRDYKINDRQDLVLREILFRKGAVPYIILPENILDQMINGSRNVGLESHQSVLRRYRQEGEQGFLGHPENANISLESAPYDNVAKRILNDPNLLVTDNFEILKGPLVGKRIQELTVAQKLKNRRVSLENEVKEKPEVYNFTNDDISKLYNRQRNDNTEYSQVINSPEFMDRKSVGHPLVLCPPVESIVPVFMAGRPHEHIGYFLLVDQNGYPVSKDATTDFYGELQSNWKNGPSADGNSEILRLAKDALGGTKNSNYELYELQRSYAELVVNNLNNRLRNGMYKQELEIGMTEEIQRIMLCRSFQAKCTQLVFIPYELCVYMAFRYDQDGIGESLLSQSKMISTMRSTLLMAEVLGGIRNAVGRKRVTIRLDPDDPDPEQSINNVQSNIMEQAFRSFPLAAPDPTQALDMLARSGFDFKIETNGADYAETQVEYDDWNSNINAGNPDLQNMLRRMHISSMGMHPEKVDPMSNPDFATSLTQNDLVFSRRVRGYQKEFTEFLTKFVKTYTQYSSILLQELGKIVYANRKMLNDEQKKQPIDDVVADFISSIIISLPAPDNTQHERQSEAFRIYKDLLDETIQAYITPDIFPEEVMKVPGLVDKMISATKAHFQRGFLAQNNIMPELDALMELEDGKPTFTLLDHHHLLIQTLGNAFLNYQVNETKLSKFWGHKFKTLQEESEAASGFGGDFGGGDDEMSGGADDGFGGGDDDFGDLGLDEGGGENPLPDEDAAGNTDGLDQPVDAAGSEEEEPEI